MGSPLGETMPEITKLLDAAAAGDRRAAAQILPLVYDELRMLAAAPHGGGGPGPHPRRHRTRSRGLPAADRRISSSTAGVTSSQPLPKPCAASSSIMPDAAWPPNVGPDAG